MKKNIFFSNALFFCISFIFTLIICTTVYGSENNADREIYQGIVDDIHKELLLKLQDPSDPRINERKLQLRTLFERVPQQFAGELFDQLGKKVTEDDLSKIFHHRLAASTRYELLSILEEKIPKDSESEKREQLPVYETTPLPSSMDSRFREALRALRSEMNAGGDTWRYRCLMYQLNGETVDDRLIEWEKICPRESSAASSFSTDCVSGVSTYAAESDLKEHIKSKEDVVQANNKLHFMTYMKSSVLFSHEMTSEALNRFRQVYDDANRAIEALEEMATNASEGGSVMPTYYVAIKQWIHDQQEKDNSLYTCFSDRN